MTSMEERLTSALAARADLVQVEDLRPLEVPEAAPRSWRRPAAYTLLAAACTAAVLVPVGLALTDGGDDASPTDPPGGNWPVVADLSGADFNGDGLQEPVTLRVREDQRRFRVDVLYANGDVDAHISSERPAPTDFIGTALTVDGKDALVLGGASDGSVTVMMKGLDTPTLPEPDGQPFSQGLHDGVLTDVWTEDGRLFSSVSHEGGYRAGDIPGDYRVQVYEWTVGADAVVRKEQLADRCVVRGNDPAPCIEGPKFYPGPADPIHYGQSFVGSTDQGDVRVSLEGSDGEEVEAGDVRLVVALPDGSEVAADVPAGYRPTVDRALLDLDDTWGVHVSQGMGDSPFTTTLYVFRNGGLEILEPNAGAPFQNGGEGGETVVNWINEDGEIFSRRGQGELDSTRHETWQWRYVGGELVPESVGTWCFDWFANPTTWAPCP